MLRFDIAAEMERILEGNTLQKTASVKKSKVFNRYATAEKIFDDLLILADAFEAVGFARGAATLLDAANVLDTELGSTAGDVTLMYRAMEVLDNEMLKLEADSDYRGQALLESEGSIVKHLCNLLGATFDKEPSRFVEVVEDYLESAANKVVDQASADDNFALDVPEKTDMEEGNPEKEAV